MNYPIAETFISVQGEGYWTGTPMFFIRLAGCNVGEYGASGATTSEKADFPLWEQKKHSICETISGQRFLCDTDYHKNDVVAAESLVEQAQEHRVQHVCLTGGEPFLHDLVPLVTLLGREGIMVHIETSGTKPIKQYGWITCCPKAGFIADDTNMSIIDEYKYLIGPAATLPEIEDFHHKYVKKWQYFYLQPINGVHDIWRTNLEKCLTFLQARPDWRLSAQLHKYLEVR